LPSDHRLAAYDAIDPHDIVGETFVSVSNTAPALRVVIDDYLERSNLSTGRITRSTISQWQCL